MAEGFAPAQAGIQGNSTGLVTCVVMTDDDSKSPEDEAVEGILKEGPVLPGMTVIRSLQATTSLAKPATLTSVASASAEVFDPTNVAAIKAFQDALKPIDKGTLFLLADEPDNTAQANIETMLPPKKVKLLTDVEIAERDTKDSHERDLEVVREQTKGSAWVEVLKYVLPAIGAAILTYFGVK